MYSGIRVESRLPKGLPGLGPVAAIVLALAAAACAPEEPPQLGAVQVANASPDTELGQRLAAAPDLTVDGRKLNVDRLKRFYARRGYAPVWATRQAEAKALTEAVYRAGEHGLPPSLFHAPSLRGAASLPPLERDLLLSDAFLAYADALARGAHPVEKRKNEETLAPRAIDVAAVLDAAIVQPRPDAVLEALAPTTLTYRRLREALQEIRIGDPVPGRADAGRQQTILVNMERERWLPRSLPANRIWVNAADQRLTLFRDNRPELASRVIIGQAERRNQTPELEVPIDAVWLNPPWSVPPDIAAKIMVRAKEDPTYLARNNMTLHPDGVLTQRAGDYSGLGNVLFDMNNKFDVYLHDTPGRDLFRRDDRRISHGCIRVEEPRKLAALVMDLSPDEIDKRIATGTTVRTNVKPMPVFLVYQTAFADADGKLQFRPDIYGRDADVLRAIAPVGEVMAAR